jgi:hypothetical protein
MTGSVSDIVIIKYLAGGGLAVYVIKELFRLVYVLIQRNKNNHEGVLGHKINNTDRIVSKIEEPFFEIKNSVNDIHEVVTLKDDGTPLIYNKGLEKAIHNLNINIANLTSTISK